MRMAGMISQKSFSWRREGRNRQGHGYSRYDSVRLCTFSDRYEERSSCSEDRVILLRCSFNGEGLSLRSCIVGIVVPTRGLSSSSAAYLHACRKARLQRLHHASWKENAVKVCLVAALRAVRDQDFWPGTRCSSSFARQCEAQRSQLRPHLDLSGAALPFLPRLPTLSLWQHLQDIALIALLNILYSLENFTILSASSNATSPAIAWFSRGSERVSHGFH